MMNRSWMQLLAVSVGAALPLLFHSAATRAADAPTTAPAISKTIRVAIYADKGGNDAGPMNVEKCLDIAPPGTYTHKRVTADDIRADALHDVDVLVQPGGSGHKQAEALGEDGRA